MIVVPSKKHVLTSIQLLGYVNIGKHFQKVVQYLLVYCFCLRQSVHKQVCFAKTTLIYCQEKNCNENHFCLKHAHLVSLTVRSVENDSFYVFKSWIKTEILDIF